MDHSLSVSRRSLAGWNKVEDMIRHEMLWLENVVQTFGPEESTNVPVSCRYCLLRNIALLIVTGKVRAREIKKKPPLKSFWHTSKKSLSVSQRLRKILHGKEWHRATMQKIESHFLLQGCRVAREPNITWGRADLGVYCEGQKNLFIEVGTTSFYKLWVNLSRMRNSVYLLVPDDDILVEFVKK